jgi:hypothetical protein
LSSEQSEPIPIAEDNDLIFSLQECYDIFLKNSDFLGGYPDGVLSAIMQIPNAWLYSFRNLDSISEQERSFLFGTELSLHVCGFLAHLIYTKTLDIQQIEGMLYELNENPGEQLDLIIEKLRGEDEDELDFFDVMDAAIDEKYFKQLWIEWTAPYEGESLKKLKEQMDGTQLNIAKWILATCYQKRRGFFGEEHKKHGIIIPSEGQIERLILPIWINNMCKTFFAPKLVENCPITTKLLQEYVNRD